MAHLKTKKHKDSVAPFDVGIQPTVNFNTISSQTDEKRACLQSALYATCHTSIASIDHMTLMQKKMFPDSSIARDIQLGRTKCSKIIDNVLSPYFKKDLISDIGSSCYSLIIDESTDVSVQKQLGIIIRYYSDKYSRFTNTFLKLINSKCYFINAGRV